VVCCSRLQNLLPLNGFGSVVPPDQGEKPCFHEIPLLPSKPHCILAFYHYSLSLNSPQGSFASFTGAFKDRASSLSLKMSLRPCRPTVCYLPPERLQAYFVFLLHRDPFLIRRPPQVRIIKNVPQLACGNMPSRNPTIPFFLNLLDPPSPQFDRDVRFFSSLPR